ncbi:MAG: acyl-CoA dehydrogenase family protein [Candidatus Nanopelagicales bacterium]
MYSADHIAFADSVKRFLTSWAPEVQRWHKQGYVDRDFYRAAGKQGLIGVQVPEAYGGGGSTSFKFNAILAEQAARLQVPLGGIRVHQDVALPYLLTLATSSQRQRWLPTMARGEDMCSLALSEPDTGSDLAGVRTRGSVDGDFITISGSKTYITGGHNATHHLVLVRTSVEQSRRAGLTLVIVETGTPGLSIGPPLQKIGLQAQDTVELAFEEVVVPLENVLGSVGHAFDYLASNLPQERLSIAINAVAQSWAALETTLTYVKSRRAFGRPIGSFQNSKFVLAWVSTQIEAAQAMTDTALEQLDSGHLSATDAAKVKLFATQAHAQVVDQCLQLHGGYGYMAEAAISRMYLDARVGRIYGGSDEIMKVIIAKSLGL